MENKEHKITFFTPTFNRTGSELVLLSLIKYLPKHFKATVVSRYRGSLSGLLPKQVFYGSIFSSVNDRGIGFKVWRKFFGAKQFLGFEGII